MAIPLALQDAIFHAEKSFAVEELEEAARLSIILHAMTSATSRPRRWPTATEPSCWK